MPNVVNNSTNEIQSALALLEDQIKNASATLSQDVIMAVAATSPAVPHGAGVGMFGNSLVALKNPRVRWAGVNVGPDALPGTAIRVRGGTPTDVFIAASEGVVAGSPVYFSTRLPGLMTTIEPEDNPFPLGIVYDTSTYNSETGGVVKALMNANYARIFVP